MFLYLGIRVDLGIGISDFFDWNKSDCFDWHICGIDWCTSEINVDGPNLDIFEYFLWVLFGYFGIFILFDDTK